MAVSTYVENGEVLWQVYVNLRSTNNPTIRLQKRTRGLKNEKLALAEEKRLRHQLSREILKLESLGATWDQIIEKWELHKLTFQMDKYAETTILDYANLLRNWTKIWYGRPAAELNRGDGRDLLRFTQDAGKSATFVRRLKNTINLVYTWGIEEKLITGAHHSPVYGIDVAKEKEFKLPEILTRHEVQTLIFKADERKHPWAPVWKGALLTGMRSGELHGLPWTNVEMITESAARVQDDLPPLQRRYGLIRVHRTWDTRIKDFGPTKGGYWRTIPISKELYWFLVDLKKLTGDSEFVFPRFADWDRGQQAQVLRKFCIDLRLKSVKFHTLRACFATLLIQSNVAPTRVMKICGWKDLKTMQRYIRIAGIDEAGATEGLNLLSLEELLDDPATRIYDEVTGPVESNEEFEEAADIQVMDHVVSLLKFRSAK